MTHSSQLPLYLPVKPNYAEIDFIESSCNSKAVQWVHRWPDWPVRMMAIYGEPGCGKTHLAHIWQKKVQAYFLTPADFEQIPLEVTKKAQAFILDNVPFPENWLFHFYNLIKEKNMACLFCAYQPPTRWNIKLPDLRSRLSTILSVPIISPDEEALRTVLFKLFAEKGMALNPDVADYILRRIERSFDSVRTLVEIINFYTLSTHRQPTLGLVRNVLSQHYLSSNHSPSRNKTYKKC